MATTSKRASPAGYAALLRRYLAPQARLVALLSVLLVGGIGLQLVNPQWVRRFLDGVEQGAELNELIATALAFTAVAIVAQAVRVGAVYVGEIVAWAATNELRADLALHCLRLDMSFHKRYKPGELIERVDGDVNLMANFLSQLVIQLVSNLLLIVGVLALLWALDWRVGATITVIAAAGLLLLSWLNMRVVPRWQALRQTESELFGFLQEWIDGAVELQTNAAAGFVMRRLYPLMRTRWLRAQAGMRLGFLIMCLPIVVPSLAYIGAYVWGDSLYTGGVLTIGGVYLIFAYVDLIKGPLWVIQRQMEDLQTAAASMNRVAGLLAETPTIESGACDSLPAGPLGVAFDGVTFRYEEDATPVLSDIELSLAPGRVLGLLGRTGSGKTTLIRLLYRLYDPTVGAVRVTATDGEAMDVRDVTQAALRRRIGLVTQDVQLFHATVRDNLTLFDPGVADEEIDAAIDRVGLGDWLARLDGGLDARLSADTRLSAGEAQLLAMARVFLEDPGIVVLDEASSRIDPATERRLDRAMDALLRDRTAIIIAHRLSTVDRADEIVVLEAGRIVEHGPTASLLRDPASRFVSLRRAGLAGDAPPAGARPDEDRQREAGSHNDDASGREGS